MKTLKAALATLSLAVAATGAAQAAENHRHQISAGLLYVKTAEESSELSTTTQGTRSVSPGTRAELDNAATLGLTYTYFFDDHWSGQFVGGVPPRFDLTGFGNSHFGNLGSFEKLASVRQWSPTLLGIYTFGSPNQALRPYVGLGVSYTKFDDIHLNRGFEQALVSTGTAGITAAAYSQATSGRSLQADATAGLLTPGSPTFNPALAGAYSGAQGYAAGVPVTAAVKADSAVDAVATLGLDYRISERVYAQASVSYLPLSTTATVTLRTPQGTLATSEASMDINPIVGFIGVGYRF